MGKKKKSKQKVVRYSLDIHMGIARDFAWLRELKVESKVFYRSPGPLGVFTGSIRIEQPNLFGGPKKSGGIDGWAYFSASDGFSEAAHPGAMSLLRGLHGTYCPNFRGITSLLWSGEVSVGQTYVKPWEITVVGGWTRVVSTQYGELAASNGAEILKDLLENEVWGANMSSYLDIETNSYYESIYYLANEGFDMCIGWYRDNSVLEFSQLILNHIGGAQWIDRTTGKITMGLIRGDYIKDALPVKNFNNGILAIEEDDAVAADAAINEVAVKWFDPINGVQRTTTARNHASIQLIGRVNRKEMDYSGLCHSDIAARVAERDLAAARNGLRRFKIKFDRTGSDFPPCSVFVLDIPERGFNEIIVRAISLTEAADGTFLMGAAEDTFGLPTNSAPPPPPDEWGNSDNVLVPVTEARVIEPSYYDCTRILDALALRNILDTDTLLFTVARRPNGPAEGYDVWVAEDTEPYSEETTLEDFCPVAEAKFGVGRDGNVVTLINGSLLSEVLPGHAVLWGPEVCKVTSLVGDQLTLVRGCADTVPATHLAGERLWFYMVGDEDFIGLDITERLPDTDVTVKVLAHGPDDITPIDSGLTLSLLTIGRQGRPYPPAGLTVNTISYPVILNELVGDMTLAWEQRNRIALSSMLFGYYEGAGAAEAGTTYEVWIYAYNPALAPTAQTLLRKVTGLTATTWVYTEDDRLAFADGTLVRLDLYALREGLLSMQPSQVILNFGEAPNPTRVTGLPWTAEFETASVRDLATDSGTAAWARSTDWAATGTHSWVSPDVAAGSDTETWIDLGLATPSRLHYTFHTTFPSNFEFFAVLLDGVKVQEWSTAMTASRFIEVPAGEHTIAFQYSNILGNVGPTGKVYLDDLYLEANTTYPLLSTDIREYYSGPAAAHSTHLVGDWRYVDEGFVSREAMAHADTSSVSFAFLSEENYVLAVDWFISSEYGHDTFKVYVNDEVQTVASGEAMDTLSVVIAPGANVIRFAYSKDAAGSAGIDSAGISRFSLTRQVRPTAEPLLVRYFDNFSVSAPVGAAFYPFELIDGWELSTGWSMSGTNSAHAAVDASMTYVLPSGFNTSYIVLDAVVHQAGLGQSGFTVSAFDGANEEVFTQVEGDIAEGETRRIRVKVPVLGISKLQILAFPGAGVELYIDNLTIQAFVNYPVAGRITVPDYEEQFTYDDGGWVGDFDRLVSPLTNDPSDFALVSTNAGVASSSLSVSKTFTFAEPALMAFDYFLSSQPGADYLQVLVDDVLRVSLAGNGEGSYEFSLEAGSRTVTFRYSKDADINLWDDIVAVDNIRHWPLLVPETALVSVDFEGTLPVGMEVVQGEVGEGWSISGLNSLASVELGFPQQAINLRYLDTVAVESKYLRIEFAANVAPTILGGRASTEIRCTGRKIGESGGFGECGVNALTSGVQRYGFTLPFSGMDGIELYFPGASVIDDVRVYALNTPGAQVPLMSAELVRTIGFDGGLPEGFSDECGIDTTWSTIGGASLKSARVDGEDCWFKFTPGAHLEGSVVFDFKLEIGTLLEISDASGVIAHYDATLVAMEGSGMFILQVSATDIQFVVSGTGNVWIDNVRVYADHEQPVSD